MFCPFCGASDTKVIDSRISEAGSQVRRRRECVECNERFTTYETVELSLPRIIKSDGSRNAFDRAKLEGSFLKALEKRPVSMEQLESALNRIIHYVRAKGDSEIASKEIGELVMDELRALDKVAYVRFASVYRSFEDVSEFHEEIARLHAEQKE